MKMLVRETKESKVSIGARVARATPKVSVQTGKPFFDHMLTTFGRYAGLDLTIQATGDLTHHLMEDVALTLGRALSTVVPSAAARYGERTIPMDDALVQVVIDLGGRPYFVGKLPSRLYTHVLRSLSDALSANVHVRVLAGEDRHHITEAAFKALGLAFRQAIQTSGEDGVFSTKGAVSFREEEG